MNNVTNNKKIVLYGALLVVVILTLVIGTRIILNNKTAQALSSGVTSLRATSTVIQATSSPIITKSETTYVSKDVYDDGDTKNGASYIVLTGGAPQIIIDKVNKVLYEDSVQGCFDDPKAEGARDAIMSLYLDSFHSSYVTILKEEQLKKMSFNQIKARLIKDYNFSSKYTQSVSYFDKNILSIVAVSSEFCGGAHPNDATYTINFDLKTGGVVQFSDLFQNFSKDKQKIADIFFTSSQKLAETGTEDENSACNYVTDYKAGDIVIESVSVELTEKGLKPMYFGYPHVATPCEPWNAVTGVLPYALFGGFWKTDGPMSILGLIQNNSCYLSSSSRIS